MQRRKTSARGRAMKNARGARDATLREFKERDLGGDIESAGTAVVVRPQPADVHPAQRRAQGGAPKARTGARRRVPDRRQDDPRQVRQREAVVSTRLCRKRRYCGRPRSWRWLQR